MAFTPSWSLLVTQEVSDLPKPLSPQNFEIFSCGALKSFVLLKFLKSFPLSPLSYTDHLMGAILRNCFCLWGAFLLPSFKV